jgi:hypothetical protein
MTAKFNQLNPEISRSEKSCVSRWTNMLSTYKHIRDFNSGRINGSTGKEDWWTLTKAERRLSLTERKV